MILEMIGSTVVVVGILDHIAPPYKILGCGYRGIAVFPQIVLVVQ